MPNLIKMALNLGKEVVNVATNAAATGKTLAEDKVITERREICNKCEHLLKEDMRCNLCGCYLIFKTKIAAAKCPKGKW